eukprot:9491312-Pyramimonas_sp.AAC.1
MVKVPGIVFWPSRWLATLKFQELRSTATEDCQTSIPFNKEFPAMKQHSYGALRRGDVEEG